MSRQPRNDPCDRATGAYNTKIKPHGPHEWDGDLGDEGYECWGYPIPDEQPEQFWPPVQDGVDNEGTAQ